MERFYWHMSFSLGEEHADGLWTEYVVRLKRFRDLLGAPLKRMPHAASELRDATIWRNLQGFALLGMEKHCVSGFSANYFCCRSIRRRHQTDEESERKHPEQFSCVLFDRCNGECAFAGTVFPRCFRANVAS